MGIVAGIALAMAVATGTSAATFCTGDRTTAQIPQRTELSDQIAALRFECGQISFGIRRSTNPIDWHREFTSDERSRSRTTQRSNLRRSVCN